MERKNFLKSLMIGMVSSSALVNCKKDNTVTDSTSALTGTTTTTTGGATTTNGCTITPEETEGPFPTHIPASYVRSDITDGRTGYKLTSKLTVVNHNNNCNVLSGLLVDIWHCDAEGNYSEYGGSTMQSTNYTTVHFLRGRQTTDATGTVTFTSIFPGWYSGRATHIHVHIYTASGTSLKITQIAFPEGAGTALVAVNGYAKGLTGYTYNKNDGVFSDDTAGIEIATVTGNTTNGFALSISLAVAA